MMDLLSSYMCTMCGVPLLPQDDIAYGTHILYCPFRFINTRSYSYRTGFRICKNRGPNVEIGGKLADIAPK